MMIGKPLTIVVVLLLAGCAAPAATRDDSATPSVVGSLDVDLHDYVLNITMPAGPSTAVVVLNVTKEMWVHPYLYDQGQFIAGPATTDSEDWVLCIHATSRGLAQGNQYGLMFLELKGTTLSPASVPTGYPRTDQTSGTCVAPVWHSNGLPKRDAIRSAEPRDMQLAVVAWVGPTWYEFSPEAETKNILPWNLKLGVATESCIKPDGASSYCGPGSAWATEADARGGAPSLWLYDSYAGCHDCGFEIEDHRQAAAGASAGSVTGRREGPGPALTYYFAYAYASSETTPNSGLVSATQVRMTLEADGKTANAECTLPPTPHAKVVVANHGPAAVVATFEDAGRNRLFLGAREIPIDLNAMGWTLAPTGITQNGGGQECL